MTRTARPSWLALPVAAVLAAAGGTPAPALAGTTLPGGVRGHAAPAAPPATGRPISGRALEERHGLRLTRVAVTGGGGLVDLRFTVVDPVKARRVLDGPAGLPRLSVGDGPPLSAPHHGAVRSIRLQKDAACYLLYPNARGAVKRGSKVTVAFGGVRVEPVVAQ